MSTKNSIDDSPREEAPRCKRFRSTTPFRLNRLLKRGTLDTCEDKLSCAWRRFPREEGNP